MWKFIKNAMSRMAQQKPAGKPSVDHVAAADDGVVDMVECKKTGKWHSNASGTKLSRFDLFLARKGLLSRRPKV